VLEARDGDEALKILESRKTVGLVIADADLPGQHVQCDQEVAIVVQGVERGLEPAVERLVVDPLGVVLGGDLEQRIDPCLDRPTQSAAIAAA